MARPKGATPRKAPSTMSFFAAMLVGMILTVGIGLFVYLWNPFNQGKTTTAEEAPMVQPKVQDKPKTNNYEFYDLLKEQQVSAVPDEAAASQPVSAQPDVVLTQPDSAVRQNQQMSAWLIILCCLMIMVPNHALQPTIAV